MSGKIRLFALVAVAAGAGVGMAFGQGAPGSGRSAGSERLVQDYVSVPEYKEKGWLFGRPAKDTPEEQFVYAAGLEEKGSLKSATGAYNAIVKEWAKSHPEIAKKAQLKVAELFVKRGKSVEGFREYQYFIKMFSGADAEEFRTALGRQYAIANGELAKLDGGLWSASDPDTVADMYRRIVANAPDWDRAAECQFKRGACLEAGKNWLEAALVYEELVTKFPWSDLKGDALYRAAFARVKLSDRFPRDERSMRNAIYALRVARGNDRGHADAEKALGEDARLYGVLAGMNFAKAEFYDRIRKKPEAAVIAYRSFAKEFAGTAEAARALSRAEELGN